MRKKNNTPSLKIYTVAQEVRRVVLIGCGGTGGILAEHLARMIAGFRLGERAALALVDGDVVTEANVGRQSFYQGEVGLNKAEALAFRLSAQLGLEIAALPGFVTAADRTALLAEPTTLTITATDSLASRRLVAGLSPALWLDAGNDFSKGQAILGTTHEPEKLAGAFESFVRKPLVTVLPDVAALNPALLARGRKKAEAPTPSCAAMPYDEQGFGVNAAAALAAAILARQILVDRSVTLASIWFDVAAGRFTPQPITRQVFAQWAPAVPPVTARRAKR